MLTNADVVALARRALGDDVIIAKIGEAPRVSFRLASDDLIELADGGVSEPVIEAMLKRATNERTIRFAAPGGGVATLSQDADGAIRITPPPPTQVDAARGVDARAQAQLRNAATSMEAFFVDHDSYAGAEADALPGFVPMEGVDIKVLEATQDHFRLRATAAGGTVPSWTWDSRHSKIEPGR